VGALHSYHSEVEAVEISDSQHRERTVVTPNIKMPEPVIYTPGPSSRSSSVYFPSDHPVGGHIINIISDDRYDSPPPVDERIAEIMNERRYRLLLTHGFHPSRKVFTFNFGNISNVLPLNPVTLPLWDPSPVELGAVGYLSKPAGRFITLFNANNPRLCDHPRIQSLPSIHGYGQVVEGIERSPKKTVTQRAIDMIVGSLTFRNSSQVVLFFNTSAPDDFLGARISRRGWRLI